MDARASKHISRERRSDVDDQLFAMAFILADVSVTCHRALAIVGARHISAIGKSTPWLGAQVSDFRPSGFVHSTANGLSTHIAS